MYSHPKIKGIMLHTDDELAELLGGRTVKMRETVHEWPLSCVQKLTLSDGGSWAYKSQLPPTVEPDFYAHAKSDLLPEYRFVGRYGGCGVMLIKWIDAPLLGDAVSDTGELIRRGREIAAQISELDAGLPVYIDIGSEELWRAAVNDTLMKFCALAADGRFRFTDCNTLTVRLRSWSESDRVLQTIARDPRIIHGDLKADQIFLTDGGYKVIDWQRPYKAPSEVDIVSLLVDRNIDPHAIADISVIGIYWFLRLYWATEAQYTLFPDRRWPIFGSWAEEAIDNILHG